MGPIRCASCLVLAFGVVASAASAQDLAGRWSGKVNAPQGRTEIGFEFTRVDGGLAASLTMPIMHCYGAPVGPAEVDGNRVRVPVLDTEFELVGERLVGRFALGKLPIELERGGEFAVEPAPPIYPSGPAPLWKFDLGAESWASPLAHGGAVYVGASDGSFHAVRARDGAPLWKWKGSERLDGQAVASEDALFFVDEANALVRLDRETGTLAWRVALHDEKLAHAPAPRNATFNHRTATPLVVDGAVWVGSSDGGLYAVDAKTGKVLRRREGGAPIYSGVVMQDRRFAFGCMDGSVVMIDGREGTELLRAKVGGGVVTTPVLAPTADGERVIVGARDYMLYGLDAKTGAPAWKFSYWFSWVESTPKLVDGVLYVGASDFRRVTALEPGTGRVRWSSDVLGMNWGSPVVTGLRVFCGTAAQRDTVLNHEGALVALDRASGSILWLNVVAEPEGAAIWGYAGSLESDGERLFAAGLDGLLAAYPLATK